MYVDGFFQLVWLLGYIATFFVALYAFIDCLRTQAAAFPAADKQTRQLWLILLGAATLVSVMAVFGVLPITILVIAGLIVSIIYLVDVRPAVRSIGRPGEGPYGPW